MNAAQFVREGKLYLRGRGGLPKDYEKAHASFDAAARLGDAEAMYQLAKCYLRGMGCLKDGQGALSCFESAANKGHAGAARKLAECFSLGVVAPHCEELARYWQLKAAALEATSPKG